MSAASLPGTSGLAASNNVTGSSTPRSRRGRCNAPRSDTGIKKSAGRPRKRAGADQGFRLSPQRVLQASASAANAPDGHLRKPSRSTTDTKKGSKALRKSRMPVSPKLTHPASLQEGALYSVPPQRPTGETWNGAIRSKPRKSNLRPYVLPCAHLIETTPRPLDPHPRHPELPF